MTHDREEHTVDTNRSLNDERGVTLVGLRIKVFDALTRVFLMLGEVEVGTRVNTLYLLETKRHLKLNIRSGISIVCQFIVVVETIVLCAKT